MHRYSWPGPALECAEGDGDPKAAGAEAHQESTDEVDAQRHGEDETKRPQSEEGERHDQNLANAASGDAPAGERKANDDAEWERRHEKPITARACQRARERERERSNRTPRERRTAWD